MRIVFDDIKESLAPNFKCCSPRKIRKMQKSEITRN